ncbi:MAG: purine nucleoside permease [Verrucomicrobiota bacterium]
MIASIRALSMLLIALGLTTSNAAAEATKEVRVVIVTLFEQGEDIGDKPGEFQLWAERLPLPEVIELPHGNRDLRWNQELGVLGMVTGIGTAKAAASVTAVALDPRFDFSNAYWLLVGIAGFDPEDASLASTCWVDWVVDGDLSHTIDIREAPEGWPTGRFPFRAKKPYQQPRPASEGSVFQLNEQLTDWAYEMTKGIQLTDTEALQKRRALHTDFEKAMEPPFVTKGSYLAAMNYWHGTIENEWANKWVAYWTDGEGEFVASAMEGSGMMIAMEFLDQADIVDRNRVMMLRAASNFTMQWPGATAIQSKRGESIGSYSAFIPSLESAYATASPVVREISSGWDVYKNTLPGTKE